MNDFGLYDAGFKSVDVDEKITVAKATYNEIVDERVISAMAGIADSETYSYLIDSNGFEGEKRRTLYMSTAQVSVLSESDERPEDYFYVNAQHWDRLQKEGIGAEALKRTLSKIGASRVESGVYDIVVDRRVVSQLVNPVIMALRGESLHMQSSFLLDKKGEKIGSDKLTIVDNPRQYDKAGARLFDNEGIAVVGMPIIENGVLRNYYISNYMSKKMDVPMTQANPTILDFALGDTDTAGLIRNLGRGIYVTGFNGGNCNGTTGDFSFGIEGFWVENGVIVKPVSEMLITGDMLTLWSNLVDTSNDPLDYSAWKQPSLLFSAVVVN
jgi:PmbA protein